MSTSNNNVTKVNLLTDTVRPLATMASVFAFFKNEKPVHIEVRIGSVLSDADIDDLVADLKTLRDKKPANVERVRFFVSAGSSTSRVFTEALMRVGNAWMN